MKKALSALMITLLFPGWNLYAHGGGEDFMRSIGKMYVVVAAIAAIFIGIVIFLVILERKLTKLENQINSND